MDIATSFVFFQSRFFFFFNIFELKTGRIAAEFDSFPDKCFLVKRKKKYAFFFMAFLGKELRYFVLGKLITKKVTV